MGDEFEVCPPMDKPEALEVLEPVEDAGLDDAPEFAPSRLTAAGNAARFAWWWLRDLARRLVGRVMRVSLRAQVAELEHERGIFLEALLAAVDESLALQRERAQLHAELHAAYERLTPMPATEAVPALVALSRRVSARHN